MKYLCPACERLVPLDDFKWEDAELSVRCEKCGHQARARTRRPLPPQVRHQTPTDELPVVGGLGGDPIPQTPDGHCPKCVARRPPEASACPHCGLVFDRFQPGSIRPSNWLEGRWKALREGWSDAQRHEQLVSEAATRGELPDLGRLYRLQLAHTPLDPFALKGRDEVLRWAMVATSPQESSDGASLARGPALKLVMGLGVIAASVWLLMVAMSFFRR